MRYTTAVVVGLAAVVAVACSSPTSTANSCGSSGANANVNFSSSNHYSPSATTITHGESVCWQSGSVTHTVTADSGAFDVTLPPGQIFIHQFPTAGVFPYHCKIHGETGTVTVN